MEINNYIDFEEMFLDCIKEHKDHMRESIDNCYDFENWEIFKDILNFYYMNSELKLEIDIDECEIRDDIIIFQFSKEDNDANESNNQNSWCSVQIVYNRFNEEFSDYQYEQG